jgi:hypothetical protein
MDRTRTLLACLAAVTLLAACNGEDAEPAPEEERDEQITGCQTLDEAIDGIYVVGEAGEVGEVEIAREDDTIRVVDVRPAPGWTTAGDTADDDDEVTITFSSERGEVDFEAEIDDDRLRVEICDR